MQQLKDCLGNFFGELDRDIKNCNCSNTKVRCTEMVLKKFLETFQEKDLECVPQNTECYGRHLLYRNNDEGYSVVMMVWGPGQGTAIHDHNGIWCVEGVAKGELEITDYELTDLGDNTVDAKKMRAIKAGRGAVGNLIPPFEHHKICNVSDKPSISIHVYGAEIKSCTRFVPSNDGHFLRETVHMTYDSEL
jgi:predicted metal-dependent enzyme (double-stranded beta helix superfamily)